MSKSDDTTTRPPHEIYESINADDELPTEPETKVHVDAETAELARELHESGGGSLWECFFEVCQPQTTFVLPSGAEVRLDGADSTDTA